MSASPIQQSTPSPTVPDTRMRRGSLAMAWYGLVSAMFFVYIGAALALAYGTVDALIGLALTIVVYGAVNKVLSAYALRHGLTVHQFSRTLLGRAGALLATLIFAATAIYYAVFEGSILAFAFQAQFGGSMALWSAIVVLYTTPLVSGGIQRRLDKVNGLLLPLYWGGLVVAVVWAGLAYGFSGDWLAHATAFLPVASGGPGWLACFAAYMGVWIMMMYTMDFAALGRPHDVAFHSRWTFGWLFYTLAFGLNAVVGIFLTFTIPGVQTTETGVAAGLVTMMGPLGLLLVFVSQTRINTANYALGASNLREFAERTLRLRLPRLAWAIITSAIIFTLMLLPVVQYLLVALAWQGALVTGWVGIALTHLVMDRFSGRGADHAGLPDANFRAVSVPGVTAWVVSAAVGIGLIESGQPWGATWGTLVTPVLAAAIYAGLRVGMRRDTALVRGPVDATA
ncbi:allantoin permease [Sinomonas cyclohexanicum]|uniref:Allantoin permease n=1 Tax=Sinomonas cyclohexanicum TaxID=322009 RepID=A0ABM7PZT0_SINCY|nr:permease [Corynebacterium cyclohexanicum]BCT77813.1 allantoin permease [Corynebacterium cyclohexanicum]